MLERTSHEGKGRRRDETEGAAASFAGGAAPTSRAQQPSLPSLSFPPLLLPYMSQTSASHFQDSISYSLASIRERL